MSTKEAVLKYARMCSDNNLTVGTAGNVSVNVGDTMYITPSSIPYDEMVVEDILEVNLSTGTVVNGSRKPSSETPMHTNIYKMDSNIKAIVHTHSTYATMFACANISIPPVHYMIADIGREVAVTPYARFGSELLAEYAVDTLKDAKGVLLANHGVVAVGTTIDDAYRRAETIEELARLAYGSFTLNSVKPLSEKDLKEALEGFKSYIS